MATGNWIPIDPGQRLGARLRNAVDQLRSAQDTLQDVYDIMSQMVAGGTDYTGVEQYFGIPAGSGQTAEGIVGTAATDVVSAGLTALVQRLG